MSMNTSSNVVSLQFLVLLLQLTCFCKAGEFTFELHDREKQCFFEDIDKGVSCMLEYQVSSELECSVAGIMCLSFSVVHILAAF